MADTSISITAGAGTSVDTRTESTNGHHRQVIVIGDPSENNSVLGVNASQGIKVYSETSQAVTNASLDNIDVLLSTRLASGSTLPITNSFLDAPLSNLLASGSTLPITNAYLPNLDVPLSTRLASGSTLPITNVFLDTPLSTRLASGSTLPITNTYLQNIDVLLSTRLASGSTLPITNAYLDVPLSTRLASGSTLPITGNVGLLAGTNYVGKTRLTDGTTDAEVIPLTGYNAQAVGIVDGDGNQVTSFGGGVQYQEGYSSSGSSLTGTVSMWEDGNSLIRPASTSLPFPINNVGNSIGLLQSGSTLPITNSYLENMDVLLSTRLASGSTLPMTNAFLDVPLSTRLASGSTLPITGNVGLLAGTNALGKLIPPDYDVTSHTAKAVKYYTSAGAATDGIIWSPAAGKRWHVATLFINVSAAATVTLEDDLAAGDNPIMKMELAANSGVVIPFGDLYPLTSGEDAADLLITTSAGNVYVTVVGYEI